MRVWHFTVPYESITCCLKGAKVILVAGAVSTSDLNRSGKVTLLNKAPAWP